MYVFIRRNFGSRPPSELSQVSGLDASLSPVMSSDTPAENPYEAAARAAREAKAPPVVPKLSLAKAKAPYQRPPDAAEWIGAVHELHRTERETQPKAKAHEPDTEEAVNRLGRLQVRMHLAFPVEGAASSTGSLADLGGVRLSEAMAAQEEYHRNVGATFQSGFEPQRHSTFVLGRPVQVLGCAVQSEKIQSTFFFNFFLYLLQCVQVI